jgi:hypothetical protein
MDGLAALRGAAMLRARLHKEIQATALPGDGREPERDISPLVFVSRGGELLKRTRQGALHWKLVTVYINSGFEVIIIIIMSTIPYHTIPNTPSPSPNQTQLLFAGGSQDAECTYGRHLHQNQKV